MNKTIGAIEMVIDESFVKGNWYCKFKDNAYSTLDKTAYDVFQYLLIKWFQWRKYNAIIFDKKKYQTSDIEQKNILTMLISYSADYRNQQYQVVLSNSINI